MLTKLDDLEFEWVSFGSGRWWRIHGWSDDKSDAEGEQSDNELDPDSKGQEDHLMSTI